MASQSESGVPRPSLDPERALECEPFPPRTRQFARGWTALFVAGVLSTFASANTSVQDESAPKRPRVALVLSGGGARGAAHVGVLRELERQRVPVDLVLGTSMGAIVGGLYSSGMSPDEIEAALVGMDWGALFDDDPPRTRRAWRRKQEDVGFLVPIEAGWKDGGLTVPRGIVQGQNIEPVFRWLALRSFGAPDFDHLRLPFRAVAMDLATGERVVLERGDLALAMRASMSIAGAFAPVEIDGRQLVDGGYVENLPVGLALELGADVVIAVDVGTPLVVDTTGLGSFLSVTSHVQDTVIEDRRRRDRSRLRDVDVLMTPRLGTITFVDFARSVEAMECGLEAARGAEKELAALSVSETDFTAFLARQRATLAPPPIVRSVRIVNDSRLDDAVVAARLGTRVGDKVDTATISDDLERLYGLGVFQRAAAQLTPLEDGAEITYSTDEKHWGPNYLRLGLALTDDFHGAGRFSLGLGLTVTPFDTRGAEWRTNVAIGTPLSIATELWLPLDRELRWFLAPLGEYERRQLDLDEDPTIGADVSTESWELGMDVGRILGEWGEVRAGLRRGEDRQAIEGQPSTPEVEVASGVAIFAWDTLDTPDFPTSGVFGRFEGQAAGEFLGGDATFESVRLTHTSFVDLSGTTVGLGFDVGTSFDDELPLARQFRLGGFGRVSGLPADSELGDSLALARLLAWHGLSGERKGFGVPIVLGGTLEAGAVWDESEARTLDDVDPAASIFLGADTPLGPAVLGFGITDDGRSTMFLAFGRLF